MSKQRTVLFTMLLGSSLAFPAGTKAQELSFADRVRAQEAIERVYYRHQIGSTAPFEQAVPRTAIEAKVVDSLRLSLALERFWKVRVDGEALRRELDRIERSTALPDRLREIYRALENDPILIHEVLARGALVERMARRFHEEDVRTGRSLTREWDRFWPEVARQLDPAEMRAPDPVEAMPSQESLACLPDDSFDPLGIGPVCLTNAPSVWTGSFVISWGSSVQNQNSNQGGRYDPLLDTCVPTSTVNAPSARYFNSNTWTGQFVVVYGGQQWIAQGSTVPLGDGGRYDPLLDSWLPVPDDIFRYQHLAFWTGQKLLVWGGRAEEFFGLQAGRLYDPSTNLWSGIATTNQPSRRYAPSGVWTGSKMIVWGGGFQPSTSAEIRFNDGGIYDLASDTWTALSTVNAPPANKGLQAFWTGSRMFVWLSPGRLYDPATNSWGSASSTGAPATTQLGAWSGRDFIILNFSGSYRYDALLDTWRTASPGSGRQWIDTGVLARTPSNQAALYVVDNDRDGLTESCDPCPLDPANDADGDGHCGNVDNCALVSNPVQRDGDGDGVGDLCDRCPAVADPSQADLDGDGAGDACDCQPADPLVRRPAAVTGLTISTAALSWDATAGADDYSVTRGTLAGLGPGQYGPCLANGITQTSLADGEAPAAGSGWFYLVQGNSLACGPGSLGTTSAESPRVNADPAACAAGP